MAICQSHSTLHHGIVWLPTETTWETFLKGPAGGLVACACLQGMLVAVILVQEARERRLTEALRRLHPELLASKHR